MVYFRKRLTPEVLGEINEMIVRDAKERQVKEAESKDDDDDSDGQPGTGGNSGTMIVDATCAPSNIRYPQDVSLLNEARENAETLLDVLHDPADGKKPRTYRKRARKDYLKYTRCRKHTAKMTRKAIGIVKTIIPDIERTISKSRFMTCLYMYTYSYIFQAAVLLPGLYVVTICATRASISPALSSAAVLSAISCSKNVS